MLKASSPDLLTSANDLPHFVNCPLLIINEESDIREICIVIVFYHFKFKYAKSQPGCNPTNYPKDMIQVYHVSF